jgi:hypothetical protein
MSRTRVQICRNDSSGLTESAQTLGTSCRFVCLARFLGESGDSSAYRKSFWKANLTISFCLIQNITRVQSLVSLLGALTCLPQLQSQQF